MADAEAPTMKRLKLRYPDECSVCGIGLSRGAEAVWDRAAKKALCLACAPSKEEPAAGVAGTSAASEGARRRDRRVEEVRRKYGDHAAAVAEEMAERDNAATWGKGSQGESRLAAAIAGKLGDRVVPLHDRLVPGTRRNIDHIFVAPSGVWVVDAKTYKGKVESRSVGPFWSSEKRLYVGGRNRTSLVASVEEQIVCVLAALKGDPVAKGTFVHGALCFMDAEWGVLDFPFQVGNVWVTYLRALRKQLEKNGPLARERMEHVARRLDLSLPWAGGG